MTDNNTDFARGTDPLGKATAEAKVWLSEEANDALGMLASTEGLSKSEYLRNVINEHLYGRVVMTRLLLQRARGSGGSGTVEGR